MIWSLVYRVKNLIEKQNEKNLVFETVIGPLVYRVKNLIEEKVKKKPGLWDCDMVTGVQGLKPDWKEKDLL